MNRRRPHAQWAASAALVAAAAAATTLPWLAEPLVCGRALVATQPWRLLTGALVHRDLGHLVRDLLALVPLSVVAAPTLGRALWPTLALAAAAGNAATLALQPSLMWVLGSSGAAHAVLAVALMRSRGAARWVGGTALLAKLVWEAHTGHVLGTPSVLVAWPAHATGALIGAAVAAWTLSHTARARVRPTCPRGAARPGAADQCASPTCDMVSVKRSRATSAPPLAASLTAAGNAAALR